ncbi:MAG: DUF2975 domain-containing protein [Nocardioides sp.]|uniref:DUF2975 domain-containing protein n=1 Tax=Nocardioides sp. TaxID=35761 RepID=UPI003266CB78
MTSTRDADPLKVLEILVGVIVSLMAVVTVAVCVGAIAGSGSIPGLNAEVCVTVAPGRVAFQETQGSTPPAMGPMHLSDGIRWHTEQVRVCDPDPDGATRALGALGLTVWVLAPLIFFGLLWRLLRRARREGVFADRVPGGLRLLGGILLVWATLDFIVTGFVNAALLNRMTDEGLTLFMSSDFPWLQILLAVALLGLERVMAQALVMRRDVEATI